MFKILNLQGLGVAGRQNELIELALTYKFDAVEVDMDDLVGRHDAMGKQFACQFLQSAKIKLGTFRLPVDLGCDDEKYAAFTKKIPTILDLARELGCERCYVPIETSSNTPFQENFETHRTRLMSLAAQFADGGVKIGLALQQPGSIQKEHKFIRTVEEILTLIRTVAHPQVGLCMNTWQWAASGGGMDQVAELKGDQVTELRMADIAENADPAHLKKSDRVLPGEQPNSMSLAIFNQLRSAGYDGPISIATEISTFNNRNRDAVIHKMSQLLDRMIAGEDIYALFSKAPEPEAEATPEAESTASEDSAAAQEAASSEAEDAVSAS